MNNSYSATTETGTLGRRLSNHSVFWKQDSQFFFFFANGLIKFNYAAVENFKTVWSYLTSQETAIKFMNVICSFAKKLKILLFSKNVVSLQSSSKCHGSSSHTVWSETSRHFINDYDLSNQHTKKFGITVWFVLAFHLF